MLHAIIIKKALLTLLVAFISNCCTKKGKSFRTVNCECVPGKYNLVTSITAEPPLTGALEQSLACVSAVLGSVHTTPQEFENAPLFLRLGLPSTLIRHENGVFRDCSSNRRNLRTPAFHLRVDGKHFENGGSQKRWRHDDHVIFLTEFSSNTNPK